MTKENIEHILNEIGSYDMDLQIQLSEVSEIILGSNENLYPDNETSYIFDSSLGLLFVYRGSYNSDGEFTVVDKVVTSINFSLIEGFALANLYRRKAPYTISASV